VIVLAATPDQIRRGGSGGVGFVLFANSNATFRDGGSRRTGRFVLIDRAGAAAC
jgi:hypothetical protein